MQKSGLARLVPHLGRHGRAERWWRVGKRPRIWAHRGASAHKPENTLAAFELAKTAGADGIELDVQLDRDGHVVVFHDYDLMRLCERTGTIETLNATERKALRVRGECVPTLAEVFDMLGDTEVNVELKAPRPGRMNALAHATANVIRQSRRADQVLVSSFDPLTLVQFHRYMPNIALAYLYASDQSLPARRGWVGTWMGASVLHPEHTLCTAQLVKNWHTAGMPVNTWTVDDPVELVRLTKLGVDGVFTNDPDRARAALADA